MSEIPGISREQFDAIVKVAVHAALEAIQAEQKRLDSFLVAPGDTIGTVEAKKAAFEQYLNDKEAGLNAVRDIQGQAPIRIQTTPRPAGAAKPASEMTEEEIMAELAGGG